MAIEVGMPLDLDFLLAKHHLDQTNYIERLEIRGYRNLVAAIDEEISRLEFRKQSLIDLKKLGRDLINNG